MLVQRIKFTEPRVNSGGRQLPFNTYYVEVIGTITHGQTQIQGQNVNYNWLARRCYRGKQ